ncbi:streptomycin 6-kinase [Rhizobium azooxidifex]|uniref:Streptomycin 6-kinase n=1 Tax=Mycoplana azooxidifex TaxID=1636188 RepID=A0A7W6D8J3_9HYPH|nr:aminoglycoside phosphotransferase family protein [Mycoplana azooxidifex]MBB3976586.1 streptomycin 6-kinase [Mycoplana azooxidifex]
MASDAADPVLAPFVRTWSLVPDGRAIVTPTSHLLPVRWRHLPAMLKVATVPEEASGGRLMAWWDGDGAAAVYAQAGEAILLERALGTRSLAAYARNGRDDEATRILCGAVRRLHAPRSEPLPELVPLDRWFEALGPGANAHGGILPRAAATARNLLADQRDIVVLHGDVHHDNFLDFGDRGWLTIDPKGLRGERSFDFANIFCNPDLADPSIPVATRPERFEARLEIVCAETGLDRRRLLQWILAWAGLSAVWYLDDGMPADIDLGIAALAAAALDC